VSCLSEIARGGDDVAEFWNGISTPFCYLRLATRTRPCGGCVLGEGMESAWNGEGEIWSDRMRESGVYGVVEECVSDL
jgi:hypothetical protein